MKDKDKEYLYVGEYYHTRVNLQEAGITEKKIGITTRPSKRADGILSGTKNTIGFKYIKLWEIDGAQRLETALHGLLKNERLNGEWFRDNNGDLVNKVTNMLEFVEATEVSLDGFIKPDSEPADDNTTAEMKGKWWTFMAEKLKNEELSLRNLKPRGWKDFSIGKTNIWLSATFAPKLNKMDVRATFVKGERDEEYKKLADWLSTNSKYEYILKESGSYWIILINNKYTSVSDQSKWDEYSSTIIDQLNYFKNTLKTLI